MNVQPLSFRAMAYFFGLLVLISAPTTQAELTDEQRSLLIEHAQRAARCYEFVHERTVPGVAQPFSFRGQTIRDGDHVLWQMTTPVQVDYWFDGRGAFRRVAAENWQHLALPKSARTMIAETITAFAAYDLLALSKHFDVSLLNSVPLTLTAVPRTKQLANRIRQIRLALSAQGIQNVLIEEPAGQSQYRFTPLTSNGGCPPLPPAPAFDET